ncbi:MAG: hypothetical protein M1299_02830, partial [Firmicutes bacterium]|nr:hypothetical protein [Bacillota bacterium]
SIGRIAGPAWLLFGFLLFFWFRKKEGLPLLGNIPRDWESEQKRVLHEAGEFELLAQYEQALKKRDEATEGK